MHFATETHLKEHEKVHECEKPFACRICNESFATTSELTVHAAKHEQYQCKICNMMFPSSAQCTDHVNRVHMMGLSVDDVFFSNPNSKQQRGKKSSNRTCNLCNRTFTTAASFQVHVKLHENETSFTCPVCLRQFKLEVSFDNIYLAIANIRPFYLIDFPYCALFHSRCYLGFMLQLLFCYNSLLDCFKKLKS